MTFRSKPGAFLVTFVMYCGFFAAAAKCAILLASGTLRYGTTGIVCIVVIMISMASLMAARTLALFRYRIPGEMAGAGAGMLAIPVIWLLSQLD
ncbi:hypothetical protein [Lysobacter sp. Root604]|uniref:hypothetical protein n=1 Tax=Lysobacter sp. Root604 TaxID=1736568 RepID=UPI000B153502|nr:hypothetical protein [Lysobacter sp. Root604]